ncbi:MAG: hypothetical protein OS130_04735 [Thermodesulfobacteriota bacterium]|jgi:hypothetical protein|nr:MAG: hypothetical protein OS130_04735 [Thermodesulfobacteriota bacterium]
MFTKSTMLIQKMYSYEVFSEGSRPVFLSRVHGAGKTEEGIPKAK